MYVGICKEIGETVPDEEAFDYAFDRCMKGTEKEKQEFREVLDSEELIKKIIVDWYFSGNWVHKEDEEYERA
ncbi:uncharacterized protein BN652_01670 [Firmicutes bacterium CAG:424]|jgi:hypothetical protein|nr:uncharacterized protein BN652_01670 [Firmicutes bacterium CAG:424]